MSVPTSDRDIDTAFVIGWLCVASLSLIAAELADYMALEVVAAVGALVAVLNAATSSMPILREQWRDIRSDRRGGTSEKTS